MSKYLFSISGLCLLTAVAFVPIGYGGTFPWAATSLNVIASLAVVFWTLALLASRRLPHIPLMVFMPAGALLALGWFTTWNARAIHDPAFWQFLPVEQKVSWLPGSVDATSSLPAMIRLSAFLGALLVACDLCRDRRWARSVVTTVVVTGTATAAFGIWQKVSHQPFSIWNVSVVPPTAFATFWYHGNAASYLNLTWPLLFALTLQSFSHQGQHLRRAICLASLTLLFAALALNVSKAGHAIAMLLIGVIVTIAAFRYKALSRHLGTRHLIAYGALIAAALVVALLVLDWGPSWTRWQEFLTRTSGESRLAVARICLDLSWQGGALGHGPGTFDVTFQHHVARGAAEFSARWKHAHNDYLQILVEWGWVGSAIWAWLLFTPINIALGIMRSCISPGGSSAETGRPGLRFGVALSLLGLFVHAAYDFPMQIAGLHLLTFVLCGTLVALQHSHWQSRSRHRPVKPLSI